VIVFVFDVDITLYSKHYSLSLHINLNL